MVILIMKRPVVYFVAALVAFSFASCSSIGVKEGSKWDRTSIASSSKKGTREVRTTAYTHTEADHIVYSNKTAIGK